MDHIISLVFIHNYIFSLHRVGIGYIDSNSTNESCVCIERIAISVSVFMHCSKRKDEPGFVNFVGC